MVSTGFLTILAGWGSRAWIALSQMIAIRLWTDHLGINDYAALVVLVALQGWLLLLDAGLGQVLQNYLVETQARGVTNSADLLRIVRWSALIGLGGASLWIVVASGLTAILPALWRTATPEPWPWATLAISGAFWAFLPVAQLVYRIWFSESRGWLAFVLPALAQGIACGLIAFQPTHGGPSAVVCHALVWILPQVLLPLICLWWRLRRISEIALPTINAREIWCRARGFCMFALLAVCILQIDIVVIATIAKPNELVEYATLQRVFAAVMSLVTAMITAMLPTVTVGLTNGNGRVVMRSISRCLAIGMCTMAVAIAVFIYAADFVASVLIPSTHVKLSVFLIILVGTYWLTRAWTDTWAGVLMAGGATRPLIIGVVVQGPVTWLLMMMLAPALGVYGIAAAMTLGFLITVCWWLPRSVLSLLHSTNQ